MFSKLKTSKMINRRLCIKHVGITSHVGGERALDINSPLLYNVPSLFSSLLELCSSLLEFCSSLLEFCSSRLEFCSSLLVFCSSLLSSFRTVCSSFLWTSCREETRDRTVVVSSCCRRTTARASEVLRSLETSNHQCNTSLSRVKVSFGGWH